MSDQPKAASQPVQRPPLAPFPPLSLPTVYADGVLNIAPGPQVVKFYLVRLDPSLTGSLEFQTQPFVQVVMPTSSFIHTAVFFEQALKQLVEQGLIGEQAVNDLRKTAAEK